MGKISAKSLSPEILLLIDLFCVGVCMHTHLVRVFVYVQVHVHVCGGQRTSLGGAPQELSPWFFETGSLTGTRGSLSD